MRFSFYKVSSVYCDFLRAQEPAVPYTRADKSTRPFVGVVFELNGFNYYAPLTSPKPKHLHMKNRLDFLKINGGQWGALNFNNMLPVAAAELQKIELKIVETDSSAEIAYKNLLANQLSWCNSHREVILRKANKLYQAIVSGKDYGNLLARCCNFPLLEELCSVYQRRKDIGNITNS